MATETKKESAPAEDTFDLTIGRSVRGLARLVLWSNDGLLDNISRESLRRHASSMAEAATEIYNNLAKPPAS